LALSTFISIQSGLLQAGVCAISSTDPNKVYRRLDLSEEDTIMRYLHTMVRVKDLDASLHFYTTVFGLKEVRRIDNEKGRFTLVFLAAPDDLSDAKDVLAPLRRADLQLGHGRLYRRTQFWSPRL
jgi:hypothetical protein